MPVFSVNAVPVKNLATTVNNFVIALRTSLFIRFDVISSNERQKMYPVLCQICIVGPGTLEAHMSKLLN